MGHSQPQGLPSDLRTPSLSPAPKLKRAPRCEEQQSTARASTFPQTELGSSPGPGPEEVASRGQAGGLSARRGTPTHAQGVKC